MISILIGISGLFVGFIAGVVAASIGDEPKEMTDEERFYSGLQWTPEEIARMRQGHPPHVKPPVHE